MLKHQLLTELLWLLIACVIALGVVAAPILSAGQFPFQWQNAAIVFGCITLARLLFFHQDAPWLKPIVVKALVCIALLPIALLTIWSINSVQTFVDANGFAALFSGASDQTAILWGKYIRNEVILFGAGLLVCSLALPVVLLIQVFKQIKAVAR